MTVYVKWEPRDLWVGVFVDKWRLYPHADDPRYTFQAQRTYICILPCLPIVIERRG